MRAGYFVFDHSLNTRNFGISDRQKLVIAKDWQTQDEKALDSASIGRDCAHTSASGCASTSIFVPRTDIHGRRRPAIAIGNGSLRLRGTSHRSLESLDAGAWQAAPTTAVQRSQDR